MRKTLKKMLGIAVAVCAGTTILGTAMAQGPCPSWVDARTRYLDYRELGGCSCWQLEILRNEIYARHGRIFNRDDLQSYFSNQPWYMPDPGNPSGTRGQNRFEQRNAVVIREYEKSAGCR